MQVSRFLTAHAIMLSLKGMPGIYFHSMFGSRGWPEGVKRSGRLRTINRQKSQRAELEDELSDPGSLRSRILQGMRHMLAMRRKSTAFSPDAGQEILHAGDGIFACARSGGANHEEVLCLHNVTPMHQEFACAAWKVGGRAVAEVEVLDGSTALEYGSLAGWRLAPYESIWLRMKR